MLVTKEIVNQYVDDHRFAWAEVTQRDERYRLTAIASEVTGDAKQLWEYLEKKGTGKYTRKTIWTRVMCFWDWFLEKQNQGGKNAYRDFKRKYAQLFRNAYVRTSPDLSFQDARGRIERISDPASKRKALELLGSGCRFSESFTYWDGYVVGKGDKPRAVYMPKVEGPEFVLGYHAFRLHLKEVGLKPHDLRKVWACTIADNGVDPWTLCDMAGWSNITTSMAYINNRKKRVATASKIISKLL